MHTGFEKGMEDDEGWDKTTCTLVSSDAGLQFALPNGELQAIASQPTKTCFETSCCIFTRSYKSGQ